MPDSGDASKVLGVKTVSQSSAAFRTMWLREERRSTENTKLTNFLQARVIREVS